MILMGSATRNKGWALISDLPASSLARTADLPRGRIGCGGGLAMAA